MTVNRFVMGVFAFILVLFTIHMITHLTKRKKCQYCKDEQQGDDSANADSKYMVTWVGTKAAQSSGGAGMGGMGMLGSIMGSLGNSTAKRNDNRMEMCHGCYTQRRRRMRHQIGSTSNTDSFEWENHTDGVRNGIRDWE